MAAACALLLAPAGIGRAQDVFNGSYSADTASDSFSTSCIASQKPNIWKQLGINPLTCQPQTMGQDAKGQCTLKGATVVAHQGGVCYYCEALNPPGQIYIPYDQVQAASVRGFSCGTSPVDPGCMAICRQQSTTTTTTLVPKTTGGGGTPEQRVPETTTERVYPIDTSTSSENQPCQPPRADEPAAAPYYRYQAGFQTGFNDCKVTPTIVGDVAAAAFGSVYSVIPSTLEISDSAKTLESVIHPAGAPVNSNPYLEGETDGGRLCTWLLKNEAGWVTECPGKTPPATQTQQTIPSSLSASQVAQCICGQLVDLPPGFDNGSGKTLPVNYGPANAGCTGKSLKNLPKWTPAQADTLRTALDGAITMLKNAKAHTDKIPWDDATQELGTTFLGNASQATQATTRDDINGALLLAQRIKNIGDNIFPGDPNAPGLPPVPKGSRGYAAYVIPWKTPPGQALIFILPLFWAEQPWGQSVTLVHELSHELEGGLKDDVVYGQQKCQDLVGSANADLLGKLFMPLIHPDLPPNIPPDAPMKNADSFAYFVYWVARENQK